MTCKICGYENNNEDAVICEFCKNSLEEQEEKSEKTVWDKLFIINIFTCSIIILICLLLVVILFFIK